MTHLLLVGRKEEGNTGLRRPNHIAKWANGKGTFLFPGVMEAFFLIGFVGHARDDGGDACSQHPILFFFFGVGHHIPLVGGRF